MPSVTIDTGNTAFMLLCSSLVMLMTPGLLPWRTGRAQECFGPSCVLTY